jgi:hypothetical protein
MAIYTPYSDKHNKNYNPQQGQTDADFSRKPEISSVQSKGKNLFPTELKEPFGQK